MNTIFEVKGMTCGGCEQSVARIIRQLPEVADVTVDRTRNQASVSWRPGTDTQTISAASLAICDSVSAAGYDCSTS